ncbi:hypothetical protein ARMGADRAFT_49227 [Armillaria gallica]|uniref:Protein kinase domain-containing protein n=1 Tax=Armillaria gallica TaxID=47427 RepID=A0A2H3EVE1_ARMGA|nr:hypothetical protein ARMGADRAFT_49227 [Armillaria gallica]
MSSRCSRSAASFLFLSLNASSCTYFEASPMHTATAGSCSVHADLKHDNIFFETTMSTEDIDQLLASNPSHRHPLEYSHGGLVNAVVSEFPIPTLQEAMQQILVVADFGSAQLIDTRSHEEISPLSLRPFEIIIDGSRDGKTDIWTFGCLSFEFITGGALFK